MKITLELNNPNKKPISHLSMGHITFITKEMVYTSKEKTPDQSSMIFFAVVEMLDLLIKIKKEQSKKSYQFVATDSSFILNLKHNNGELAYGFGKKTLENCSLKSFAIAFNEAIDNLFTEIDISIEDLGILKHDFQDALDEFKKIFIK